MDLYSFSFKFIILFITIFAIGLLFRPLSFRNVILSIYFFFVAYLHLALHIIEDKEFLGIPHLLFTHFPFGLSLGPLAYFFILSLTENKNKIERWEWLHFLPAFISIIITMPLVLQSPETKITILQNFLAGDYIFFRYIVIAIITIFAIYVSISIKKIWINIHTENPSHQKILAILITLLTWIFLVFLKAFSIITLSFTIFRISNILLIINIIFVYFVFQRYPTLFLYGTMSESKKQKNKSYLEKIDTINLERELNLLMNEEKFYCDEDLTLKRLSAAVEITPHQLSEFLNNHYSKNFNTYINTFRIEESKKLLLQNIRRNTLSIAYAVGFNSYSAFYTAFKNETKLSPADFRKKNI